MNSRGRIFTPVVVVLLLLQTRVSPQPHQRLESDSSAVAKVVQEWADAIKHNDVKLLERILADDFMTTNVDGSVNSKEHEIAPFRAADLSFDTVSLQELSIKTYGSTAIVRGVGLFTGKAKWGGFSSKERFTDLFLKRDGRWQAVASHSSALKKK